MSLNIDQIAEAFCSYKFAVTYPYMADEIKWSIVGRQELAGWEAVKAGNEGNFDRLGEVVAGRR